MAVVVVDGETFYSGMEVVELLEATDENCVAFRKWESGEGFWGEGEDTRVCNVYVETQDCQSTSLMGESWLLWPTVSESQNQFRY